GFLGAPIDERVPEGRSTHGKTNESRYRRRRGQPLSNLFVILASTQHDAADSVSLIPPRRGYNFHAILTSIETFDFPNVGFHAGVLKLMNGLDHKSGTKLQIVRLLVSLDSIELGFFGRNQKLEHEQALRFAVDIIGKTFQAGGLALVES